MNQLSATDSQARPALHIAVALGLFAGLWLFYGSFYSVHQDLAGSALSGRLAITLGESFRHYSIYFPPAERAWFSLAALLSGWTGIRLDLAVVLMTAAAVLVAAGLAYRIRRQAVGASPWFLILPVAVLTIAPILFKNVFGLREHMVALGLWPYLVLRVSDPDDSRIGWRLRLLVGLWAGANLLFKYLYCVVILLVEVADALVQRRPQLLFRLENLVAGAVVALYLLLWLGIDPSQRAAIGAMRSAIDANIVGPGASALQAANNLVAALFFLAAARLFQLPLRIIALGLALVVGTIVAAWVQARWYSHHLFPITLAYIAWWWMAGRKFQWWGHIVMPLLLAGPIIREFRNTGSYQAAVKELEWTMDQAHLSVTGKRVGILTMHPSPYNQYLASHGAWRWNAMANIAYVGAELKPFDTKENARTPPPPVSLDDPGRRMLHEEMLRLWEDQPPDVLILDHSYRWPLRYLDVRWLQVFSADPRFKAVIKHFRPVLAHDGERVEFQYYVRAD